MNRHCCDPRVFGPIVVAALLFWLRPAALPPAPAHDPPRSIELPPMYGIHEPPPPTDWELDAERSTVRFLVGDGEGAHLVACPRASGRLHIPTGDAPREIELTLDLGSLQPVVAGDDSLDLWQLLGVHRGGEIRFRGTQLRWATSNLPGITQRLWLGTLRLDARVVRQPMELWQVSLPGQPLRLQGHGSVLGETYGMPIRSWFGFAHDSHVVTLGLDLVWRRQRGR